MSDDDQGADESWPPDLPEVIPGVPAALLAEVKGILNFENFLGDQPSSRSAEYYLRSATAGAVFTSVPELPAGGDTVSRGLWQLTLTPDPVAPKGLTLRQEVDILAADCFGADRPTLWAARIRVNSIKPTAASYDLSYGGLCRAAGSTSPASDGVYVVYDPTLGVDAWVCRASRAAADLDSSPIAAFDSSFHTMGYLHRGTEVVPFVDGVVLPSFTGPEIQPAAGLTSYVARAITLAAGAVTPDSSTDWVLWGS